MPVAQPPSPLRLPLSEIASTLSPAARAMSLEKLGLFLRQGGAANAGKAAQPALRSVEEVAEAILSLPIGRRRMREVERAVLAHALARSNGNVSHAAQLLGVTRQAVQRRLRGSGRRGTG